MTVRHPWGGYKIVFEKRGTRWRFRLVNKFLVTVYTSGLDWDRQKDARGPAKAFKAKFIEEEGR
jgi:hypothetical protein